MKTVKVYILAALIAVTALNSGCGNRGDKKVLATINKKDKITLGEFNEIIAKLPGRYQEIVTKNKRQFLDELIVDRLLYNEGMQKKLDKEEDVRKLFNEAKRKIVMARLLKDEVEDRVAVDTEEIEDYYAANEKKFITPETLRASHILVKTEEEADNILVDLSNGRNFEDLARARSVDPTSERGGDIGYFTRNQLVPGFEEVCFGMQAGEISGVVKTKFGYHIIKLTERKPPRVKELAEVRDTIEQSLERLEKKMLFNEFVTRLKERSQISVNKDLLESISEDSSTEEKSAY
jgi:peptidyl-prolyl cis-trans isomerase C